jgi:hypothetical protein
VVRLDSCISRFFINEYVYARLLCHFFNKQVPLRKVRPKPNQNHAEGVGFQLEKIFVIDGSKRSAKLMPISGFSELRNG